MKKFFINLLGKLMVISYSNDNHYLIFSNKLFCLKFKRHSFNWYKSPNDEERIQEYLEYKSSRNAIGVVYTCITNDYDDINELLIYKYIDKDWDYVLFTDNEEQIKKEQVGIWQVRPLQFASLDNTRKNRWHKLNPHLLFPEYTQSIYIDATINILTDYLFKQIEQKNLTFIAPKHYKNKCIYSEYKDVIKAKLDSNDLIYNELELIKKFGMPKNYGFCENNILYRKHNDEIIKKIDEEWWNMVVNYSKRDQLSLCYLLWKYNFNIKHLNINNSRQDHKNFFVLNHIANYKKGDNK